MANDFQYVVKQHYANAVQERLEKNLTAMELAEMIDIPNGTTKNLPLIQMRSTGDYTKYTDQTITDVATSNDQIVIDTTPMVNFAIDDLDEEDNYINIKPEVIADASYQIKKRIDGDFFAQAMNAKWKFDANGFGVNAGTLSPITLVTGSSQNISSTFGGAKAGLVSVGGNGSAANLVVDPFTINSLNTVGLEQGYKVADEAYTRGFKGGFGGMKVYEAGNLYGSTVFDLATEPTAGDYFYIQGVKFTFVANGTAAAAGEISVSGTAATTVDIIVTAINGTGTPWASTYIELSSEDRARLEGVTATDGTTSITITSKGGQLTATSSMTAAANDFQAQVVNCVVMEKGAIKMALRNSVKVASARETKNLVTNYFIYARYGLKVTTRSKERMVVVPVVSKAAEA